MNRNKENKKFEYVGSSIALDGKSKKKNKKVEQSRQSKLFYKKIAYLKLVWI